MVTGPAPMTDGMKGTLKRGSFDVSGDDSCTDSYTKTIACIDIVLFGVALISTCIRRAASEIRGGRGRALGSGRECLHVRCDFPGRS